MIDEKRAKKYCSEDISLIENYQEAIDDKTQTWVCHHRLECVNRVFTSPAELIKKGLYKNRPASELIFLTRAAHNALHNKDPKMIENMRKSLVRAFANPLTKIKMHERHKGKYWWNNGVIAKLSKTQPGPDFIRGRLSNSYK